MVPSSITGRKASSWARLKRWISSTKSSVPLPVERRRAGRLEHLLEVRDAGKDRRDLLEMQIRLMGQQPRDRGLAGARRPPEDQRAEGFRRDAAGVRMPSGPTRWSWPTTSESFVGRIRSASGRGAFRSRPAEGKGRSWSRLRRDRVGVQPDHEPFGILRRLKPGAGISLFPSIQELAVRSCTPSHLPDTNDGREGAPATATVIPNSRPLRLISAPRLAGARSSRSPLI